MPIRRLKGQSYQSQSLVMCYKMSTRDSLVSHRRWEREKRTSMTEHQGGAGEKAQSSDQKQMLQSAVNDKRKHSERS